MISLFAKLGLFGSITRDLVCVNILCCKRNVFAFCKIGIIWFYKNNLGLGWNFVYENSLWLLKIVAERLVSISF